jgi:hemerythrin-like domain-containing protein
MKPMDELKMEHEAVRLTLRILEKIYLKMEQSEETVNPEHVDQLLEFFSVFVDKCHHGKEEELLFPALEQIGVRRDGGPIGVMLMEHQQGREFVRKMKEAFSEYTSRKAEAAVHFTREAKGYIALLDQHIAKENNVLFPLAEKQLPDAKQSELSNGFEMIEVQKIGIGRHEEFHKMLENLESVYLRDMKTA